jgi:hypothetical protein
MATQGKEVVVRVNTFYAKGLRPDGGNLILKGL